MRHLKTLLAASTALAFTTAASADDIAIVGGDIITMAGDTIEGGTVIVSGSTIKAVGKDIAVPEGYKVIDAKGKIVTPGLMVSKTTIGLNEGPYGSYNNDSDASKAKKPIALDVTWGINPDTTVIPVNRVEGITRTSIGFSSFKGIWSGQGAVIHLGESIDPVVKARTHVSMAADSAGATEMGSRSSLWFSVFEKFDAAQKHLEKSAEPKEDKDSDKVKEEKPDPERDVFASLLEGKMTLVVRANKAADLIHVISFAKRYPTIKIAVNGAGEGWRVADELAAAEIPVIVNGMANDASRFETLAATLANAGRLAKAGVKVAFVGTGDERAHLARQHAGLAVANGMDAAAALAALTTVPASIYGVSDSYGTLEVGMDADVVVWDGDPLEVMSNTDAVIIQGKLQSAESRQTKLRDRYLDTPRSPQYK